MSKEAEVKTDEKERYSFLVEKENKYIKFDQIVENLKSIIEPISTRFTKNYLEDPKQEEYYTK